MGGLGLADKIERIDVALTRAKIPHAFGGALALAYYATPRATIDLDVNVFVSVDRFDVVAAALRRAGTDRIPEETPAVREGQVRAWWGSTPIDLFFSYDEIHEAMRAAVRRVPFGKKTIPILAPEHLLVAKAVFNRAKDWLDVEQMLVAVNDLDLEEVEKWMLRLLGNEDPRSRRYRDLAKALAVGHSIE